MILKPRRSAHRGNDNERQDKHLLADYLFDERDGSDTDSEATDGDNGSEHPTAWTVRPARRNAFALLFR